MLLREKFEKMTNLSEGQKSILQYMCDHSQEIASMTIKELAQATYTSPATLIRVSKKLGYNGFDELKKDFLTEENYINTHFQKIDPNYPFLATDNYMTIASKITTLAKETADDTLSLIDFYTLQKAVKLFLKAEKIHLTAISFPLIYGRDFQLKLRRIGKNVEIVDLLGEQLYAAPIINKTDCALMISYSGETPLIRQMIKIYQQKNVPIIAITGVGSSTLRSAADVSLSVTTREKLYSKISGYSNLFSIKLILDILYSCIFKENYDTNLENKKSLSKLAEPGRFSTSEVLREDSSDS